MLVGVEQLKQCLCYLSVIIFLIFLKLFITMATYFPYSYILGDNSYQPIVKHQYFGEWSVCDSDAEVKSVSGLVQINELYY